MTNPDSDESELANLRKLVAGLPENEREALNRFYVLGQDAGEICRDLGLDRAEFRELAARVKKAFAGARRLQ